MWFSPSTYLLIFLSLETLYFVHHKDWLTYSGGMDKSGELCYNFSISNDLNQMANFPNEISDCDSHSPALLDLFLSSEANVCSTMAFPHWEILIMLLSQFPLTFHHIPNGMPYFIALLMTILMLIGSVFRDIPWEDKSLNWVLLLLPVNFVSGFRLELM